MKIASWGLAFLSFLIIPIISFAAWVPGEPLVPECEATCGCGFGEFSTLVMNLLDFMIYLGVFIMVIVISYAGWMLMTSGGNPGARDRARKMVQGSVVGFIVLLAAFLIVDTFFNALTNVQWNTVLNDQVQTECPVAAQPIRPTGTPGSAEVVQPGGSSGGGSSSGGGTSGTGYPWGKGGGAGSDERTATEKQFDEAAARAELQTRYGIKVNRDSGCAPNQNGVSGGCTDVSGIQKSTIDKLDALNKACDNCGIVITSGSEKGHSNPCHTSGTCVDIRVDGYNYVDLARQAKEVGFRPVFETQSCSLRDQVRSAGITAYCSSDRGYSGITGNHFSLYSD